MKVTPGDFLLLMLFHGLTKGNDFQRDKDFKRMTHRMPDYGSQVTQRESFEKIKCSVETERDSEKLRHKEILTKIIPR